MPFSCDYQASTTTPRVRGPRTVQDKTWERGRPAKNHRWVLRIRASVTDLLPDPTLVAQFRSVESLHSKHLLESPIGFA
jgi:hypothetical protein